MLHLVSEMNFLRNFASLLIRGKVNPSTCIAPCMVQTTLKRSEKDHTVLPAINTIPAVYLVSVYQMAPPPIKVANI